MKRVFEFWIRDSLFPLDVVQPFFTITKMEVTALAAIADRRSLPLPSSPLQHHSHFHQTSISSSLISGLPILTPPPPPPGGPPWWSPLPSHQSIPTASAACVSPTDPSSASVRTASVTARSTAESDSSVEGDNPPSVQRIISSTVLAAMA